MSYLNWHYPGADVEYKLFSYGIYGVYRLYTMKEKNKEYILLTYVDYDEKEDERFLGDFKTAYEAVVVANEIELEEWGRR